MQDRFKRYFQNAIFKDDVYIRPTQITEIDDDIEFTFTVFYYDSSTIVQIWKVVAKAVENYKLSYDFIEDINEFDKHILLWEFLEQHYELYFKGTITNRKELIGEILDKHISFTEGWIDINQFINGSVEQILKGDSGLFASGPKRLIDKYKEVLESNELSVSLLPCNKKNNDKKIMIFGKSFVVAEDFYYTLLVSNS
ncbi:hypothetical protein [Paenibacillus glacialis]|uniref:Uncharacterized protein n=1 Tax=Paenibacillus glacialis TaxID=494026 RepID=A0A168HMA0_9BACL|nr:hypothetical protein [Paenibacillus glacialis]OAB38328.1 hypothetical protein PGLA_19700 [Paenibacillus glacialis]